MERPIRTRVFPAALAASAWLLAGCAEPPGIPSPTHAATVFGRVTAADGAAVGGARVVVVADRGGRCPAEDAEYLDLPAEQTTTDAAGAYRASARVFSTWRAGACGLPSCRRRGARWAPSP